MARPVNKKKTLASTKKPAQASKAKKGVKKPMAKLIKKTGAVAKPVKKAAKKATSKKVAVKKASPKKKALKTAPAAKKMAAKPAQQMITGTPAKMAVPGIGSKAPSFAMPATLQGSVSSDALKGKAYIIYFYPKDDTSGCTAEACEFRNTLPNFSKLGLTVIGVSKDSMESHEKFSRKYSLTFPLASDHGTDVCEKFGTWVQKSMYGRTYMGIERSTFVVDAEGIIRAIWRKVSVPGHIDDVRQAVANL